MTHTFGSVVKNYLRFQSQEHMSINDPQYLQSFVGICVCVNE